VVSAVASSVGGAEEATDDALAVLESAAAETATGTAEAAGVPVFEASGAASFVVSALMFARAVACSVRLPLWRGARNCCAAGKKAQNGKQKATERQRKR
jgi:hypothetical protein